MKWVEKFKPYQHQVDEVGNILQFHGAVIPKACQKCKKKFKSTVKKIPITQMVSIYKCKDCDFESVSGDGAFGHITEFKKHNLHRTQKQRIVGFDKKITGLISRIKKTKNDIKILCSDCNDLN